MFGKKKDQDEEIQWNSGEETGYSLDYEPPKKSGFGKGVVTGVLITLVLIGVIGVAAFIYVEKLAYSYSSSGVKSGQSLGGASISSDSEHSGILTDDFVAEVNTVYEEISSYFLYDFDESKMQDAMLSAMLDALDDPYSVYYNESALESFNQTTQGEYYGIGCSVSQNTTTGVITIVKPYNNTPAYEAGLLPGDVLYAVNGEEVTGEDLESVVAMIKGDEGSTVELTIVREGEEDFLYFDVERRQVEIETVEYEMLEDSIGYIAVYSFDGVTPGQFETAFETLEEEGMEGLIIDMRDNGGGLLTSVEEMLDYLLPEGLIFYAKDNTGTKYLEYSSDAKAALQVPLVVLVNGNTASAAEVFSGNVQAFGVGTLVGTTTFGKGIMQNTFYTNSSKTCAIKLTVADYYIHGDVNIHKIGLTPDVEVELDEELASKAVITKEEDNQLQKGLEILKEKMNNE